MNIIQNTNPSDFNLLPVLIDLLSLIIVILFFILTRQHDRKVREYERKSIWYKEIIISPHIATIENFFFKLDSILKEGRDRIVQIKANASTNEELSGQINNLIRASNSHLTTFRKEFVDIVHAMDSLFAKDLFDFLNRLQDRLNERIETCLITDNVSFNDIIREGRISLFNKLFHNQFLETKNFLSLFKSKIKKKK